MAVKKVTQTFVNETEKLVNIHVNGETISATPTHPFYVYKFGWSTARSLRAGDVLVLLNGEHVVVEWVDHEFTEQPVYVYNFEVKDFQTYFVGASGILVHNGDTCPSVDATDDASKNNNLNINNDVHQNALKQIKQMIKDGKKVDDRSIIYDADDFTVRYGQDIGENAHPIRPNYPKPVDHYNIEVRQKRPNKKSKQIFDL